MLTAALIPWGRHEGPLYPEVSGLCTLTVLVLPAPFRGFASGRADETDPLSVLVSHGDLPDEPAAHDALVDYVVALRRQGVPYRYLRLVPVPGLLVLVSIALVSGHALALVLVALDLAVWLGWVVYFHQRELRLRHMEWLLGLAASPTEEARH